MIRLPPAGWAPNPNITGGNIPSQSLWIHEQIWEQTGRPATIEDFFEKLRPKREECCCSIIGCEHVT